MKTLARFICVSDTVQMKNYDTDLKFLILESNPLEGYYSNLPLEYQTPNEHHYFMLMKSNIPCFQDKVIRSISLYKNDCGKFLHVYPGYLQAHGKDYNFIRFRKDEFDDVLKLLPYLEKRGIEPMKHKKFGTAEVKIQFKQKVEMMQLYEDVYKDMSSKHVYFIPINKGIEYDMFEKIITYLRNNCDFKHFEASLVYSVNVHYEIEDYAKIYSPNCDEERLTEFIDHFKKAAKVYGVD